MSHNTFGHLFRVTTFGESHGKALGCVVDGCPPMIPLEEADIQGFLDKRRPGQSRFTTQRQEPDAVKILSGVFIDEASGKQVTTGTPIALMIENVDQRSKDYSDIKDKFRPGHADFTYDAKYGIRNWQGGGRSSARETVGRVAAGAIAPDYIMRLLFIGDVKLKYIVGVLVFLDLILIPKGGNTGGHFAHLGGAAFGWFFVFQLRNGNDWSAPVNNVMDSISSFFRSLFSGNRGSRPKVVYRNPNRTATRSRSRSSRQDNRGEAASDSNNKAHQERLDAILDKIKKSGYESLSKEEKEFLFNASKK